MKAGGPDFRSVFFYAHAVPSAMISPNRYIESIVMAGREAKPPIMTGGMNAAIIKAYTGSRALQLMRGATSIVARRSRGLSIVRVAMIPGTAHANELKRGMNDFPWRPTLLISLSIMRAARAM